MTKALEIATPTHAWAVSIYVLQAFLGILYVVGIARAIAMTEMTNEYLVSLWSIVLVVGGVLATIAVFMARNPQFTLPALRYEMWANTAIVVTSGFYEATLFISNGPLEVATTQAYAITFTVGGIARIVQIRGERARMILSKKHMKVTEVIADEEGK